MTDPDINKRILVTDEVAEGITRLEELAYELIVGEVMTGKDKMKVLSSKMTMQEVVDLFRQARISGAPVVKGEAILGIISMEDLIRCMMKSDLQSKAKKYMTPNVYTVREKEPVVEALKIFVSSQVGRLPVINENNQIVGIITKGDINIGLLHALQKDIHEEELRTYRASHLFEDIESDRSSLILRYNIKQGDFTHGGSASSNIKRALLRLGASPQIARRCGIAIYEAEMNLIIHTTNGGVIRVEIEPHRITIEATDNGPGIVDINLAKQPGYSTANEAIRELGFGAGMGLVNISRCVDSVALESEPGRGTKLKMRILLEEETVGEGYPKKESVQ